MKLDASGLISASASTHIPSADVYTDINGLQTIKNTANKDEALKQVAKQFESIFVSQMLKSMRQANAVFEEDSLFNSKETNFYRDMYDQQLALSLSTGKGMGIADALYRQLSPKHFSGQASPPVSLGGDSKVEQNIEGYRANSIPSYRRSEVEFGPNPSIQSPVGREKQTAQPEKTPHNVVGSKPSESVKPDSNSTPRAAITQTPVEFVKTLLPSVTKVAKKLGLEPEWLIAQAALESGWGKFVIADKSGESSHNIFNIKAHSDWQGSAVTTQTLEHQDGKFVKESAAFRRYEDVAESVEDYAKFISESPRYRNIVQSARSAHEYISGISDAGYATDPEYTSKVMSVLTRVVGLVQEVTPSATKR